MSLPVSAYVAGRVAVELNGEFVGFVNSASGGEVYAEVLTRIDASGMTRKRPGPARFTPIVIEAGADVTKSMYDWVATALAGGTSPRDGALVFCDYALRERWRLEFTEGVITNVATPVVDATSALSAAVTITIEPAATKRTKGSGGQVGTLAPHQQKPWLAHNFRLEIGGAPVQRASRVESILVTCAKSGTKVSNVSFTIPEADGQAWYGWLDDFVVAGHNDASHERDGVLELLDPSRKEVLLTTTLASLGIVRVANVVTRSDAAAISRLAVEMYCETVAMVPSAEPAKPISVSGPAMREVAEREDAALVRKLHDLLDSLGVGEEKLSGRELAARLVATAASSVEDNVGASWARQHATLSELQLVAGLHGADWSVLVLPADHSLVGYLRDAGLLRAHVGDPVVVDRDPLIEAVVAAVAAVQQEVSPYLTAVGVGADPAAKLATRPHKVANPKIT